VCERETAQVKIKQQHLSNFREITVKSVYVFQISGEITVKSVYGFNQRALQLFNVWANGAEIVQVFGGTTLQIVQVLDEITPKLFYVFDKMALKLFKFLAK
jgi:hypothetical protein